MMNFKTLLICSAALLFGSTVGAMPYVADSPADIRFDASHPFYSGTFDITGDGFDAATQYVSSASASLVLGDVVTGET